MKWQLETDGEASENKSFYPTSLNCSVVLEVSNCLFETLLLNK